MLQVCETKHHSLSTEPRNKDQIYNARRVSSADNKDEIFNLLEMLQEHASLEDGFLRDVILNPNPCAVLLVHINSEISSHLLSF